MRVVPLAHGGRYQVRLKKAQPPNPPKKSLRGAFHLYKPEKLPTILSDELMHRAYLEIPEDKRTGWSDHTLYTYAQAESRRAYRQAHVLKHWNERDRQTLFMLVLGWTPTVIGEIFGISRQAVAKRVNAMLEQTGMESDTQLVLWFLGFIALRSDNTKAVPGTTLIDSCDELQKLLYRRYRRHTS
jgi:DNA-binding CsgD family transcriptional regulator